jgi:Flp pilus assembly protein TadD
LISDVPPNPDSLLRKHPDNPSYQFHLGAALLSKGDTAKARSPLKAALANKPNKQEERENQDIVGEARLVDNHPEFARA